MEMKLETSRVMAIAERLRVSLAFIDSFLSLIISFRFLVICGLLNGQRFVSKKQI